MSCDEIRDQFAEYLIGEMSPVGKAKFQSHIAVCPACREEIESLSAVWARLGVLPKELPSSRLRAHFYAMLEDYQKGLGTKRAVTLGVGFRTRWQEFWSSRKPAQALLLLLILLAVGAGTVFLLNPGRTDSKRIETLGSELQEMRRLIALSMLDKPSATERLEAISWSSKIENPDHKILQALINTLDGDSNVNVRLAAVDALYLFRNNPLVRMNLVRSLAVQRSPLVQVALIDLLVEIREHRAAEALRQLIQDKKLKPEVKQHAELGLKQII